MHSAVISRHRTAFRILWLAAVLGVVVSSLLPASSAPVRMLERLPLSDKALHFCAYALLAFLPVLYERLRTALVIAACLTVMGVLVEFGQAASSSRLFEIRDMAANGCGVVFGLLAGLPRRGPRAATPARESPGR